MSHNPTQTTDNWDEVRSAAQATLEADLVEYIRQCAASPQRRSHLISVLHKVQGRYGYLSREHMDAVAQLLGVPSASVTGVATFYHFFRLHPVGRHKVSVCLGTACYVKGGQAIADRLKEELGVDYGQTSGDGLFTLEPARCLGTCGLAPVIMIDGNVHGPVTPDQIPAILESYRRKTAAVASS